MYRQIWPLLTAAARRFWSAPDSGMTWYLFCAGLLMSSVGPAADGAEPWAGLVVRSAILEQLLNEERRTEQPVSKQLLGTPVDGCQTTITRVSARVRPDPARIRVDLINSGVITSRTRGLDPQAVVVSQGTHAFEIIKPIYFDGRRVLTERCYGRIQARQVPVRVISAASSLPLIGGFADQIAWSEVLRRAPEYDDAVARDLSTDVLPTIDRETDRELARLDEQLRSVRGRLALVDPGDFLRWAASSTEEFALLTAELSRSDGAHAEISSRCLEDISDQEDLVLFITQDLANELIEKLIPENVTVTDSQLNAMLQEFESDHRDPVRDLRRAVTSAVQAADREPTIFSVQLAARQPLQLQFLDGTVRIVTTFQIVPRHGVSSGWQMTETTLRGAGLDAGDWTIDVGGVTARPVDESSGSGADEAPPEQSDLSKSALTATMWSTLIQRSASALIAKIPRIRLSRRLDLSAAGPRLPSLKLHRIRSDAGILRVSLRREKLPASAVGAE